MTVTGSASGYRQRIRTILKLALPITAGMASQNLLNLVDTAMVGRLGTTSQAAVGISGMALWVLTSLLQGFSPAVQAITARRLGENAQARLHHSVVSALYLILFVAVPLTLLLRNYCPQVFSLLSDSAAVQQEGIAYLDIRLLAIGVIGFNLCFRGYFTGLKLTTMYMKTLICMHVLNVILNYGLIFGELGMPELGVRGAAWGTTLATALGSLIFLIQMIRHRNPGFSLHPRQVTRKLVESLLKLGLPSCIQSLTLALGFLAFFRIAGMISTEALAATYVLVNLNLICLLIAVGLGLATITLVGDSLGHRQPEEAIAWVKGTLLVNTIVLSAIGAALALMPRLWLSFFIVDSAVIEMAVWPLVLLGLCQCFDGAGIVLSYAHLGGGASKTVMIISFVNQWLLFIPACYLLVRYFDGGLVSLWLCLFGYRLLLLLSYLISIQKGRWLTVQV